MLERILESEINNRFAPLLEWLGYSMDVKEPGPGQEPIE